MDETTTDAAELTEFEAIEVESIKGVPAGANGFPHLVLKGLAEAAKADAETGPTHGAFTGTHSHPHAANGAQGGDGAHEHEHSHDGDGDHGHTHSTSKSAGELAAAALAKAVTDGKVDEKPDVALGQQIMGLLARAIQNEAAEIEAGAYGETSDVRMLVRAADIVSGWCAREQAAADGLDPDAPCGCCPYCSGMGCGCCPSCGSGVLMCSAADDAAAKASPLDGDKDGDSKKSAVANGGTDVQTDPQGTGSLTKAVEDAVTKAVGPLEERLKVLSEDLAKVKAAPVPGGPVLSAVRPQAGASGGDDWAAKAAYYRQKAEVVTDPVDRDGYRQLAREADEKAQAAPATA